MDQRPYGCICVALFIFVFIPEGALFMDMACEDGGIGPWPGGPGRP